MAIPIDLGELEVCCKSYNLPHTLLRQKGYQLPIRAETLPKIKNATPNKVPMHVRLYGLMG
jgi:hypothetical protein